MKTSEADARLEFGKRARDHFRVEMAAGAGVDLNHRRARRANAFAVIRRRLIALDDEQRQFA